MSEAYPTRHPADRVQDLLDALDAVPSLSVERGGGARFGLDQLRSLYDEVKAGLGIKDGDRARLRNTYHARGNYVGTGMEPGAEGTVERVEWNGHWKYWSVSFRPDKDCYRAYDDTIKECAPHLYCCNVTDLIVLTEPALTAPQVSTQDGAS